MNSLSLDEFDYELPEERIAQYPVSPRDASKLLIYKHPTIQHTIFRELPKLLPANSALFFNNTKVIPARLFFQKKTGATIEIFLVNPVFPTAVTDKAMLVTESATWKCMIGNLKRWDSETTLTLEIHTEKGEPLQLQASLYNRKEQLVTFRWTPSHLSFAEMLTCCGQIPLPPYLKRKAEKNDYQTYQTVYSKKEGAVAAPTAGLHFTENVLEELQKRNIRLEELTLHVSAGTFQPIKGSIETHTMHKEQIIVSKSNVETLLNRTFVTAVGTTSMRTLESLYWYGVLLQENPHAEFFIPQNIAYEYCGSLPSLEEAVQKVQKRMQALQTEILIGETQIFIRPGYDFKVCNALITNFHQPKSTLILLVAAFTNGNWKKIYDYALQNEFRFLSYGDSSILFRNEPT
ncbi:MAG: S-adenosylmethionine:tRNA ribosyltransferase-isomerase [Cytophagales bacterium]|nr:S-adenosylmethionine:tRNA ribosyltransferase-isomerase [Cytophagales bacterium]MDW8384159.1 S-adenosylmethionine:tRNA ribosyltransferase-isomerase [Flammeovirgaceae bacterium]